MSVMVAELYAALRAAGVDEDKARSAATAVSASGGPDPVTRADLTELRLALRADVADLKAELIKWNVGALIALAGIVSAIVKLT